MGCAWSCIPSLSEAGSETKTEAVLTPEKPANSGVSVASPQSDPPRAVRFAESPKVEDKDPRQKREFAEMRKRHYADEYQPQSHASVTSSAESN